MVLGEAPIRRPPLDPRFRAMPATSGKLPSVDFLRKALTGGPELILNKYPYFEHTVVEVPGIPGLDRNIIPLSIFRNKLTANLNRPAVYFIHGGGQIAGNRFLGPATVIEELTDIDAAVISVEYRLSPETHSPGPINDCYAGLVWISTHARELGIDPAKIMVYGASGGGALAAAVTNKARDCGGPFIFAQSLAIPMLDDRGDTVSAKQFEEGVVWNRAVNRQAWDWVLGPESERSADRETWSPARVKDLSGLPPTYIEVGECEVFRDEAVAYATQIWRCGGTAELHVWPGAYHGAWFVETDVPVARDANSAKQRWMKRMFTT